MSYDITKHKYKPIPRGFTLAKSEIDGLGLFYLPEEGESSSAPNMIFSGQILPFSVGKVVGEMDDLLYDCGIIRTNGGGFINHSEEPNVEAIYRLDNDIFLQALEHIYPGDEILLDYSKSRCGGSQAKISPCAMHDFEEQEEEDFEWGQNTMRGMVYERKGKQWVVAFNNEDSVHIIRYKDDLGQVHYGKCKTLSIDDLINEFTYNKNILF